MALLAGLVWAFPARADEPAPGLELVLDGWWMAPRGAERDYAFVAPEGGLSGGGEIRALVPERDLVPALRAGWRFPGPGAPQLRLTAWEQETRAAAATGLNPRAVGALLASPDFAIGRSLVDEAAAQSSLRATLVQLEAVWTVAPAAGLAFEAAAGVRAFRFEESYTVRYAANLSGVAAEEIVTSVSDARGLGPCTALGARYGRGAWSLSAGFAAAFAVGDLEGSALDTALLDGTFDRATAVLRPATRTGFVQLGGQVGGSVRLAPRWTLEASYRFEWWPQVRREARFVDDVSQNTAVETGRAVVFEGLALGVRFGAGR